MRNAIRCIVARAGPRIPVEFLRPARYIKVHLGSGITSRRRRDAIGNFTPAACQSITDVRILNRNPKD